MIMEEKLLKLKKLADAMYYAAQQLTTDASRLHKAMDEYHKFIINEYHKEELVSEDKMTISKEWFEHCKKSWYNEGYIDGEYNRDRQFKEPVSKDLQKAMYLDENGNPTPAKETEYTKGFLKGANWKKEQMLAKAVDGEVTYGKSLAIPSLGYRLDKERLDFGDKVKVIVIKED